MLFAGKRALEIRFPLRNIWLRRHQRDFPGHAKDIGLEPPVVGCFYGGSGGLLARGLVDLGDSQTAYRVVREAAPPANPYYRAEFRFMAGWIVLRFLADPATALKHFAHVDESSADPIVRARAAYRRGRAVPNKTPWR
jgi:hypothetical protein